MARNLAYAAHDRRDGDRDEVHYRARGYGPDARQIELLVVNISPHGLMARCEQDFVEGDRVRVVLPVAGALAGDVRWSLGGRVGLHFEPAIDRASYYEMLATMLRR